MTRRPSQCREFQKKGNKITTAAARVRARRRLFEDFDLFPDIIDDIRPPTQMLHFPMGVVVLDLLIHPTENRSDFCRIMAGVSHDGVDGVPEAVWGEPPVSWFDPGSFQRHLEPLVPPRFADPFTIVITKEKIIRLYVE